MTSDPRVTFDAESPDAAEIDALAGADAVAGPDALELTPHLRDDRSGTAGQGVRRGIWVVVLVALAGAGFVAVRNLGSATTFYLNADEAVAQKASLGVSPFRLQGTVECGSKQTVPGGVDFAVTFRGARIAVHSVGSPPQLFQEGIPVLLEGSWSGDGTRFDSNLIIVKHTEAYVEKNNDRLTQAGSPNDAKLTGGGIAGANLCGTA